MLFWLYFYFLLIFLASDSDAESVASTFGESRDFALVTDRRAGRGAIPFVECGLWVYTAQCNGISIIQRS